MRTLFTITLSFLLATVSARTIVVGPSQPVRSLKAAIAMANPKDSILLLAGTYKEGGIILTKSLTITGQGNPVLDGEKKYEILLISGEDITIRGITFIHSGYSAMNDYASVKLVDSRRVLIERNTIRDAYFAIHVANCSNVVVRGNEIAGTPLSEQLTGNGIHLWKSNHAIIEGNHIQGHRDGIYFEFVTGSMIRDNHSEKNIRYGLHFMFSNDDSYLRNIFHDNGAGVAVMYSKKVVMQYNHFEQNWGPSAYGLLLKDITDSYIQKNQFSRNTIGLHMEGSSRIVINGNSFSENGWAIKVQASCDNNNFHHNNFLGNTFDVGTNGTMVLNTFNYNYWDKYDGYDLNRDGTGDVPYHPVSMYSLIVEQNPGALILLRSFTVTLLDRAEKAIPSLTPENLADEKPLMKQLKL